MFLVYPQHLKDYRHALFILSYYHVHPLIYSDGEHDDSVHFEVTKVPVTRALFPSDEAYTEAERKSQDQLRLCEMAFQGEFLQEGHNLCTKCKEEIERVGEGEATCGHLTFTEAI
jgi:hypothetical protein